jgi:hypothetical protein
MRVTNVRDQEIVADLRAALKIVENKGASSRADCEKLKVALTNTLRLVDIEDSTLTRLQGSGEDLKAYLIRLASRICESNQEILGQVAETIHRAIHLLEEE